jgi:hypothetical protein
MLSNNTSDTQEAPMTDAEWKKEAARLQGAATRAKSKVKKVTMLADKIEAREAQKAAEEALRMHKLNYYELVAI